MKMRQRFRPLLYRGRPLYTQGSGKGGRGVPRRGAPGRRVPRLEISAKVPRVAVQGAPSIHSRERQGRARGAPAGCPGGAPVPRLGAPGRNFGKGSALCCTGGTVYTLKGAARAGEGCPGGVPRARGENLAEYPAKKKTRTAASVDVEEKEKRKFLFSSS